MGVKSKEQFLIARDPRSFSVVGDVSDIVPVVIGGSIMSLQMNDRTITLHETVEVSKKPYKINKIESEIVNGKILYNCSTVRLTKSSLFLLPMLGGTRRLYMWDKLFVNAFINADQHQNSICLLYRFSGDTIFLKFEQALKKFRTFKDTYDPSPYFVMFVFDVPSNYIEQFNLFVNGKYSKFSPEYKSKIMEFHSFNIHGEMAQILFQDEKRRLRLQEELDAEIEPGSELLSIIDIEEETFNPKIYI